MDVISPKKRWREHLRGRAEGVASPVIGLTATFTIDPIIPFLGAALLDEGCTAPDIRNADYNQVVQSCLNPGAAFGGKDLDVIFVAFRLEDMAPANDPVALEDAASTVLDAIAKLQSNFGGAIICAMPPRPDAVTFGLARFAHPEPALGVWHRTTAKLLDRFGALDKLYFIDLEAISAELGSLARDERKRLLYRQPYAEAFYLKAGFFLARIIRARTFEAKKCLVLDCDNTLWGGVVGEDGIGGIQIGEDFPGSAFREFQKQAKALREAGVFLALNTKNNPDDVWPVFDSHDGMVLRRKDISVAKINWRPKSENIKEIATELNIGLNALVFVDDNPFEISEVQSHAPEVTCLQAPKELSELPALLRAYAHLWDRLVITEDDRKRVERMQGELDRRSLAQELTEEEFLARLGLKVFIYPPDKADLARVTQLINKTNQFNVTTKRYAQEEVEAFIATLGKRLYCMSVSDKFGEYGLVGVAMIEQKAGGWDVDNFLMSCRVLGRGVETTLLAKIASDAAKAGARAVNAIFLPTPKNGLVVDLFERHGFSRAGDLDGGGNRWRLDLPSGLAKPDYVELVASRPA